MAVIGNEIRRYPLLDSTSSEVRRLAEDGASEGLVVVADGQTAGRGRQGRAFESPAGRGLYLSVLLRPAVPVALLSALTGCLAVAVCRAIEETCPVTVVVKWLNDLTLGGKKICGILTEAFPDGAGGHFLVLGVGVNLTQTAADFSPEVRERAGSLSMFAAPPERDALCAAVLAQMDALYAAFPDCVANDLADYRARCETVGRTVWLPAQGCRAVAVAVGDDFTLRVRFDDGTFASLSAGEAVPLVTTESSRRMARRESICSVVTLTSPDESV